MATKKNKVKFNICNVHYALITVSEEGEVTFGTPVAMPGAVSLSLEPNGEPSNFYADGYAYYTISNNMGYEGDLELAMVPESFAPRASFALERASSFSRSTGIVMVQRVFNSSGIYRR